MEVITGTMLNQLKIKEVIISKAIVAFAVPGEISSGDLLYLFTECSFFLAQKSALSLLNN